MPTTGIINKRSNTAALADSSTHSHTYTVPINFSLKDVIIRVNAPGATSYEIKVNEVTVVDGNTSAESPESKKKLGKTCGYNDVVAVYVTNNSGGSLGVITNIQATQS